jgi:hypothetical protein
MINPHSEFEHDVESKLRQFLTANSFRPLESVFDELVMGNGWVVYWNDKIALRFVHEHARVFLDVSTQLEGPWWAFDEMVAVAALAPLIDQVWDNLLLDPVAHRLQSYWAGVVKYLEHRSNTQLVKEMRDAGFRDKKL